MDNSIQGKQADYYVDKTAHTMHVKELAATALVVTAVALDVFFMVKGIHGNSKFMCELGAGAIGVTVGAAVIRAKIGTANETKRKEEGISKKEYLRNSVVGNIMRKAFGLPTYERASLESREQRLGRARQERAQQPPSLTHPRTLKALSQERPKPMSSREKAQLERREATRQLNDEFMRGQ